MSQNDESMVVVYQNIYKYLEAKGYKPQLNVINKECSTTIKTIRKIQMLLCHLVESNSHQVIVAEYVIPTVKDHVLTGLTTVNVLFPVQL